jgi:hypothetical protein
MAHMCGLVIAFCIACEWIGLLLLRLLVIFSQRMGEDECVFAVSAPVVVTCSMSGVLYVDVREVCVRVGFRWWRDLVRNENFKERHVRFRNLNFTRPWLFTDLSASYVALLPLSRKSHSFSLDSLRKQSNPTICAPPSRSQLASSIR